MVSPLLLPTLAAASLLSLAPFPGAPIERETYLMGTTLRVSIMAADRAAGIQAIEAAFDAVRRVDGLLSTWRDDSEISRLNHAPVGRPVALSPELMLLLRESAGWSGATGGAFDPAVGALVDAWDLRGEGRIPSADRLAAARAATGLELFTLDRAGNTAVRGDSSAWLDTGGFGKGVALRSAGRALRARGITSGLLNFGGQVLALGGSGSGGWIVPVAHPSERSSEVMRLTLRDHSASTSSQSERWVAVGGRRVGHVLDPRSGEPVRPWGSVTVVAEDPAVADMLSTALLVLGPEDGLRWAARRADVGVLFLVEHDGRVTPRWNRALEPFLLNQSHVSRRG